MSMNIAYTWLVRVFLGNNHSLLGVLFKNAKIYIKYIRKDRGVLLLLLLATRSYKKNSYFNTPYNTVL